MIFVLADDVKSTDGYSRFARDVLAEFSVNEYLLFNSKKKYSFFGKKDELKTRLNERTYFFGALYDIILLTLRLRHKPNLIYCTNEHYALPAYFIKLLFGIDYVVTLHGTYAIRLPSKKRIYLQAFLQAKHLVTVSEYTKEKVIERFPELRRRLTCIPLGIDKSLFYPKNCMKKKRQVCFIGNLKPRKGFDILLEACEKLDNKIEPMNIFCVGSFDFSGVHKISFNRISRLKNCKFVFENNLSVSDLSDVYRSSMLNVLPSRNYEDSFEGFGLVHAEAICAGTPTVGCVNCGNEDVIDPCNGYIIPQNSPDELAKVIELVIDGDSRAGVDPTLISSIHEFSKAYRSLLLS